MPKKSSLVLKKLISHLKVKCSVESEAQFFWPSHFPEELLDLILEHLTDLSDLIRCRGVCHSWRSAAARKLCGNSHAFPPLLLLYNIKTIIASTTKTTKDKEFVLPKMFHFGSIPCFSSYRGWLLLFQLQLPEGVEFLPRTKKIVPRPSKYKISEIRLSHFSSPPDIDEETPLYLFNPYSTTLVKLRESPRPLCTSWRLRFITSCTASDPNCIIYAYDLCSPFLAFYGLRDRKWSSLFTSDNIPVEAIFYKGHFYAVDALGVLRRLLFDIDCNSYQEEVVSVDIGGSTADRYLVESCGGVLMMVVRRFDRESYKTNFFEIFKLNWSNGKWEEVSSLGDQALFLAHLDSKLVSVSADNLEYRQNTIYFVDDLFQHKNSNENDFGLYDFGNRQIQPLNLSSEHMSLPHCWWFQPAL